MAIGWKRSERLVLVSVHTTPRPLRLVFSLLQPQILIPLPELPLVADASGTWKQAHLLIL